MQKHMGMKEGQSRIPDGHRVPIEHLAKALLEDLMSVKWVGQTQQDLVRSTEQVKQGE